jgi:hypothetical protein
VFVENRPSRPLKLTPRFDTFNLSSLPRRNVFRGPDGMRVILLLRCPDLRPQLSLLLTSGIPPNSGPLQLIVVPALAFKICAHTDRASFSVLPGPR